ncbi:MAG TPA: hypothetical protein VJR05_09055 [Acidimicrobiia bacterium]|nr:hypothetical protein [Acidimicrobiia bacterium]
MVTSVAGDSRSSVGWHLSPAGDSITLDDGRRILVGMRVEGSSQIFCQLFLPPDPPQGGVLICSPLYAERIRNERREFLAGLAWASRGLATVRFHYRGTGHSSVDPIDPTFDDLVDDALLAGSHLLAHNIELAAIMGTRLGALVAAIAAQSFSQVPLILWQPATSGERFYRDVFRAKVMGSMAQGMASSPTRAFKAALAAGERLDVMGYRVGSRLYQTAASLRLAAMIERRRVLLIQMSGRQVLSPDYHDLVGELSERGCSVETEITNDDEAWWFGRNPDRAELKADTWTEGAATATGDFLGRTLAATK